MRQKKINYLVILFTIFFLFSGCEEQSTKVEPIEGADLVLHSGVIYTVDKNYSVAQAIAIKEGRIVYVGPNEGVNRIYLVVPHKRG